MGRGDGGKDDRSVSKELRMEGEKREDWQESGTLEEGGGKIFGNLILLRKMMVVSRGEVVYSRAGAKCLILCLIKRTGHAIMRVRISRARSKYSWVYMPCFYHKRISRLR